MFAVYDEDQAKDLAQLKGTPCRPLICQQLAADCEPVDKLEVVLLSKNIETVIKAIRDSGLTSIKDKVFEGALAKRHNMRDRVFANCARELSPDVRSQLLTVLTDLERLVSRIAECLESEGSQG